MPNQALFYPWIEIRDDQWLKTSLLYWDEFRTIVPESISKPYKTDSTIALSSEGLLQPIRVRSDMVEIEDLADSVLTYLSTNEGARIVASNGYRGSIIHEEKLPYQFEKFADIHPEKLPSRVRDELRQLFRDSNRDGSWLTVDTGFADYYMTLLASKLSERTGASLVTDNSMANDLAVAIHLDAPLGQKAGETFSVEWRGRHHKHRDYDAYGPRRRHPSAVTEGLLANLAISKINISEQTPIQDLIDFKRKYSAEFGRFHKVIHDLCSGIEGDVPVEALQERVSTIYRNDVEPSLNSLKAALDGKKIKWKAQGLIKLAFMSASSYSSLAVAGLSTPIALLAGAGISLTAMGVLHNIEKRDQIRNDPFAYLLSAEREF
ncbi:MAG: hypothetical protein DBO99_07995 [gamma proteobacterium symbiont of Ctena orbiculata]|nr:MAG: hypothetical protein DBO99_07995 [gamma proteobacterium symbiont of Ctena orbiculata]